MVVCPGCGAENPDGFRLCGMCGTPLAAPVEVRRERRVVSVLFADLVGYTRRSERMDVEDVEAFLRPYHGLLRSEIERTGGVVSKFVGDGVMALYGAPVAHEDDPERAVRCGIAICQRLAAVGDGGDVLRARVGVATGEVLVVLGDGDSPDAVGDVVNTAARLESAAPTGGVLVDEWTYRATSRLIRYAEPVPVAAKGKSVEVTAWQAFEPLSAVREQARVDDLPMVGRIDELQQLKVLLSRSRREPSTQLVTVVGAPGIGKSRLIRELAAHVGELAEPGRLVRGRALAYGDGGGFWALGEVVKDLAGILESDQAEEAASKLSQAVADAVSSERDQAWVERHLRPLVGVESEGDSATRGEAFGAWRRYFESLAEQQPTVIVFEDVHWADDALLDFIDLLTERAGDVPLLIICTARAELLERRAGWGGGKTNATTISLPALTEEDTERLVGDLLEQVLATDELRRSLAVRAEGNPLYAQEYVRMLRDRGLLQLDEHGGGWRLTAEPDQIPESVYGIIAARLDTLPDGQKRFVQDAAVVGRTAWIGAICSVSGIDTEQADDVLHDLERRQLIRRSRRSTIEGDAEFSFTHALIQDVAYSQLKRADRAQKHERVALWMEQLEHGREDRAELVAHHYQVALRLRQEAGEDISIAAARARAALIAAGRQTSAVNSYAAAARYFDAALNLMAADDPERSDMIVAHAVAAYRAGDPATGAILESAYEAAVAADDISAAADVALMLGDHIREYGLGLNVEGSPDRRRAEQWWDKAEHLARRSGNTRVLGRVAYSQSVSADETGDYTRFAAIISRGLKDAEQAGDRENTALLRGRRGLSLLYAGDLSGLADIIEVKDVLTGRRSRYAAWAEIDVAIAQSLVGDYRAAFHAARKAGSEAERFGEAVVIGDAEPRVAYYAYHAGQWAITRSIIHRYLADPDAGVPVYRMFAHWAGALLAAAEGDEATAQAGIHAVRSGGWAAGADILEAVHLHTAGQANQALIAADRAMAGLEADPNVDTQVLVAAAELIVFPSLQQKLTKLHRVQPSGTPGDRAISAIADGRAADAVEAFIELGSLPLAARARMLAATAARDRGDDAEANRHAALATAFYEDVGARRLAAQAAELTISPQL